MRAEADEESIDERIASGREIKRQTKLVIIRKIHIAFMKYCMKEKLRFCQKMCVTKEIN